MLELTRAPQSTRKEIVTVRRPGADLALHVWRPGTLKGAVFYFHGLQSHAGWLWEAGPQFADNDIAFYVLDRRGSGISEGERSEIPDARTLLDDYAAAIAAVRAEIGEEIPLTLFGHCLGGSFMAALMHDPAFQVPYDGAVFCSTWLGKLHATLSDGERAALAADNSTEPWDAGLESADFTDDPKYRRYIDNDDLAVRTLTRRSRAVLLRLEEYYMNAGRELPDVPAAFVSGLTDPIVDLDDAHKTYIEMTRGRGSLHKFPTGKHYLFYTGVRRGLVNWTSAFTLLPGLEHRG
ncbi:MULTISPECIES: alpha/beta fold hydrolase [unclassified Streptomyces]|uniref:alpha/beta fold hydrolase n=1 Tax=unclassified Streptomyces TaxID=2593676 RepID=UPI001BE5300E|nr:MULTISPECIES: alpha/beta fold hydrolase [unclassified Streptomyces]MBT2406191.1 alpha/beta fold hydrolase [Streptomyces sp. ISL-21]MBT2609491.1 alpha/beta fold hydrolase [Streptomyces sp. ISL-87]